jgi:hypothetical protein
MAPRTYPPTIAASSFCLSASYAPACDKRPWLNSILSQQPNEPLDRYLSQTILNAAHAIALIHKGESDLILCWILEIDLI